MAKPQMTREELARMIIEQLPHLKLQHVDIYPGKKGDWTAKVVAPNRLLADYDPIIEDTVGQLREMYDLKIETSRERFLLGVPGWNWITGLLARKRKSTF